MTKQYFVIIIFFNFILTSCIVNKKVKSEKEFKKIEFCRHNWQYMDLKQKTELKVLLFSEQFRFDLSSFPNFIIGVTSNSDTIGIIDKDFIGKIKKNEIITIMPIIWTEDEKQLLRPVFAVYNNSRDNDLHCSVKLVFYGQVIKQIK